MGSDSHKMAIVRFARYCRVGVRGRLRVGPARGTSNLIRGCVQLISPRCSRRSGRSGEMSGTAQSRRSDMAAACAKGAAGTPTGVASGALPARGIAPTLQGLPPTAVGRKGVPAAVPGGGLARGQQSSMTSSAVAAPEADIASARPGQALIVDVERATRADRPGAPAGPGQSRGRVAREPIIAQAWRAFGGIRPRFDGLLPAGLVHDYVTSAVDDLLGSIDVEELPEMAVRLAAARLQHRLCPEQCADDAGSVTGDGNGSRDRGEPDFASGDEDRHGPAFAFTVVGAGPSGQPLIAMTVTSTRVRQ